MPALQPVLTTDFTCGYDNGFHLWRAVQIGNCLRQGYLYPRWAPDMAHGYGFPLFVFHSPLTAYVAALLNLLGLAWPVAINGVFVLGILLAAVFAYVFARDLFGPMAGLVAAVGYAFAPFQAYDVFNRGSLSESFAWIYPPLVLWAVHRWSVRRERRFLPIAAFGLAGFILTHNLFAFLFAPLLAGWVLMDGYLSRDWRVIRRGALAGLLGLGLCTFFWLPGLAERGWVQTGRLLGTWVFDYQNNFLDLRQLLSLPRATDPGLINDWPPKALGLLPALVALLPLAHWRRLTRQTRWRVVLLSICTAGCAFLTLPASQPLWDHMPLLPYIQFPWRFLGPAAFSAAMLAGIAVSYCKPQHSTANLRSAIGTLQPALIVILLVLGNLGWFYPCHSSPPKDTSVAGMIAWERATYTLGTTAKGEYLPIWVHRMPEDPVLDDAYAGEGPIVRLQPETLPEGGRVLQANYGAADATIVLESPAPFRARYLAFYYPGWRATVDGEPVPVAPTDPEGLISFDVPAGRHTVRVRFGETPLRLAADAVSILSLATLIAILILQPSRSAFHVSRFTNHESRMANGEWRIPNEVHCTTHSAWPILITAILLLTFKLALVDQLVTPLRGVKLVDGHLGGVEVATEVTFGDEFVLLGHDELPDSVSSGERFEVQTYWRALQPGGPDYGVTVNVVDAEGYRWNGSDVRPPRWHRTPPDVWGWPPDQYAIVALSIPLLPGTPPGTYNVEAVAFDHDTLIPLTAHDADGQTLGPSLPVGQIVVTAPRRPSDPDELDVRHRLDTPFGPLTLLGIEFDRDEAAPGDPVLLTTFWHADEQPGEDLAIHLALLAPDGAIAAEHELSPTVIWHPTSAWQPGDVWRGQHLLRLPAGLGNGDHRWTVRVCRTEGTECQAMGQEVELGRLEVHAPERLWEAPPLDVETNATLDEVVTLLGATLQPGTSNLVPGAPLTVTLTWRAEAEMEESYRVFLHLLGPDGALVAQSDGEPADWTRPTTGWVAGEIVLDRRVLAVPDGAQPGEYRLQAGMYVPQGNRLATAEGETAVRLATAVVQAP